MTECKTCFLESFGVGEVGEVGQDAFILELRVPGICGQWRQSCGCLGAAGARPHLACRTHARSHPVCGDLLSSWVWSLARFPCRSAVAWQVMRSWTGGLAWLVEHLIGRQNPSVGLGTCNPSNLKAEGLEVHGPL